MTRMLIEFLLLTSALAIMQYILGIEPNAVTLFAFGSMIFSTGVSVIVDEIKKLKS